MKRFVALATSVVAFGCSSNDAEQHGGDDAAAEVATASDAAAPIDASSDISTAIDSATPNDAGLLTANPPAGYARCGHATFTQAEAATACAFVGNTFLEQNLPARSCDAVKIKSGAWEVWCGEGPLYVWASLQGLTSTGKYPGCNGFNETGISSGWLELDSSASGMLGKPALGTFDDKTPIDAAWASLGNTATDSSGTGNAFFTVTLPGACNQLGAQAVVSGASISWNAGD